MTLVAARTIFDHLVKRMPCPEGLGSFNYSIVLVQSGSRVTAYIGGGTDPRWVATNGQRLLLEEARFYFPEIERGLTKRGWTYALDV
jgi:hypothetical protein